MPPRKTIRNVKYKLYSLVMLLALAWLTVSLPFVYAQQQKPKAAIEKQTDNISTDEETNSLSNTTEEKSENSNTTLSEYLHELHYAGYTGSLVVKKHNDHTADVYIAFHPDYICPPPDAFAS